MAHEPSHVRAEMRSGLTDLERDLPPPDVPDLAIRKRQPSRESVPNRRSAPAATGHAAMLSGWPGPEIALACAKCGRRDVFIMATLLASGDVRLTDLPSRLLSVCPQRIAAQMADWCGAAPERPQK